MTNKFNLGQPPKKLSRGDSPIDFIFNEFLRAGLPINSLNLSRELPAPKLPSSQGQETPTTDLITFHYLGNWASKGPRFLAVAWAYKEIGAYADNSPLHVQNLLRANLILQRFSVL